MTIGERIKNRRKEIGLTQIELAEKLGYKSKAAISTVENDKEDLTTTRLQKYAEALNTTPAYLMGWIDYPDIYSSYVEENPVDSYFEAVSDYVVKLNALMESLNQNGKDKVVDYADDLVSSNKYKKGE